MAKVNYSTHSISKRNRIEDYLKTQEGISFSISETRSPITDLTTFHFVLELPLLEARDFARMREIGGNIKNILSE